MTTDIVMWDILWDEYWDFPIRWWGNRTLDGGLVSKSDGSMGDRGVMC